MNITRKAVSAFAGILPAALLIAALAPKATAASPSPSCRWPTRLRTRQ